jgi:SAM-dependent methyltransferase
MAKSLPLERNRERDVRYLSMKVEPSTHYEEGYFYEGKPNEGKPYRKVTTEFYIGPAAFWDGYECVLDFLLGALKPHEPRTMLDLGCASGDFVGRARQRGIDAWGVDISRNAINNPRPGAEGRIFWRDLTESNASSVGPGQFDLVTGLDLLEHIYEEDLDQFLIHVHQAVRSGGRAFFDVCVSRNDATDQFVGQKGVEVPLEKEWIAVAGHVNVRPFGYWIGQLGKLFQIDWETMARFQAARDVHPQMKTIDAWSAANTICVIRLA